jgi:hypothetical protein
MIDLSECAACLLRQKDKAEYREQQKKQGFQAVLGHACDGSCGAEPPRTGPEEA